MKPRPVMVARAGMSGLLGSLVRQESSGYHLTRAQPFGFKPVITLCGLNVARVISVMEPSEATCRECRAHARKLARS